MHSKVLKPTLLKASIAASVLLLASGMAMAQSVTLTAAPTTTTPPDGQSVPMWGYSCSAPAGGVSCTAANGVAQTTGWQPPLITVPAGALTITLVNTLSFTAGSGTNTVPTSLVIVGQVGGGLGDVTQRVTMPSPTHNAQGTTWPGTLGGTDAGAGDAVFTPPGQADRVRSFGTEVSVADGAAGKALLWSNLRPGTYLIESGTEPSIQGPMGLYGVLVVTDPLATPAVPQAYGQTFDKDVALLLSEIDPVQNAAVDQAVRTAGFGEALVWNAQPGKCGDPTVHTCYPPAVNYSPLYYLINGVSFDRTQAAASALAVPAAGAQANVLLRFVNAGLRMHVPSVVGSNMSLLAEDGNKLPGVAKVQSEVFLAPGKTYDVTIQPAPAVPATDPATYAAATYAVFDRALGLSTSNQRDGGMQAYINVAGGAAPAAGTTLSASDKIFYCVAGATLAVTDPGKGLLAGAVGANGVALGTSPTFAGGVTAANLNLQSNGTFTYTPPSSGSCAGSFTYLVNGTASHTAAIRQCDASTQDAGCSLATAPVAANVQFTSNIATLYASPPPGVLAGVAPSTIDRKLTAVGPAYLNADGSFTASGPGAACPVLIPAAPAGATCVSFPYQAKDSQGQLSNTATATVIFLQASNLVVNVYDAPSLKNLPQGTLPPVSTPKINDYRWIIEEDQTFWIDPKCQVNSIDPAVRPASCAPLPVESLGYNFHTAHMPVVAQGCVGAISCEGGQTLGGTAAVCDVGDGSCRTDAAQQVQVLPGAVHLDPAKRYFISLLPGDGVNTTIGGAGGPDNNGKPFDIATACGPYNPSDPRWQPGNLGDANGNNTALCGHAMGGAQIAAGQTTVNISLQQTPLPTAKLSVFVFQDDNPLNGENDAGGGVDVIAPNEAGLGGFELKMFDQAGGLGDATGQITYDMFNQPVSNSLAGKIDPLTGLDSCPITSRSDGLVGMIPTCPHFESDGKTESPLAGQAVIANLYPGLYEIVATPAADRIARGEEWLQTNTLDGGKAHEASLKPDEPGYFQEFGPGGFHVAIGFANPKIINDRKAGVCAGLAGGCNATLNLQVTGARMSRTPDQRIYSSTSSDSSDPSSSYAPYGFTQCYVSVGPPDGANFAFAKCDENGRVTFTGMPTGDFTLTVFDQWNDIMLDGLVSSVTIDSNTAVKEFPVTQWRTNIATRTYLDQNGDGLSQAEEPGLPLVSTNVRYRDGSFGFFNNTDLNGYAGFNEVFPFMNWLVIETTNTRYKLTGVHTVYDAGGPADGSNLADGTACAGSSVSPCGSSDIAAHLANTIEKVPLPAALRVPGAVYCADADCSGASIQNAQTAAAYNGLGTHSSGHIDPPQPWGSAEGWQGMLGQNSFINFGVKPFNAGENGGINGHVIYASTRPFDDPTLSLQLSWEPGVPRVKINLYQKTVDANGNEHLQLADSTTTTSWDDWAQGFHLAADGVTKVPNMNCPGQDATSPFFQTLKNSKQYLDPSNPKTPLPNNSQFKCYDGWSQLNQIQPAPYDGMYKFPSVTARDPDTGKPTANGTNCTVCSANTHASPTDYDYNAPMLPAGRYVVEVILPPGYELVKEEDKNILLGDVYIAPVTQQFAGFGNIFIMPDQAAVNATYNPNNPGSLNLTTNLGATPRHEGDTGSVESFWPCVGAERIVPDLNSLYPGAGQAAPFAGAKRRLCDRKEVILEDQASVLAKFFIFSSTHVAGHFTGTITNDFASEFDPFSPQFGEKFGPPNLPVGLRDFTGNEVGRVYSDQWGIYNGLYFSTYGVNPPNPTGYVPQMAIACMNDPGPIREVVNGVATGRMITDPSYNAAYSNYCYETPFMPGFTAYMDTPVIPTEAFADGYNLPDSEYPAATPAIASVTGDAIPSASGRGPWVSASGTGHTLTITALGDKVVQNPNFSGPNATSAPYNQKTITRHYGFGTRPTTCPTSGACPNATIGGVAMSNVTTWSDTTITGTVPTIPATLSAGVGSTCSTSNTIAAGQTPAQRGQSNTNYRCGELVITAANGKQSIDAITVTVAGKTPTYVTPTSTSSTTFGQTFPNPLQTAIDNASPGDLIIVGPGTYRENLIVWKPVRLQGVGASSVTINADAHPAGKMDPWRREVNCLFGLNLDGTPNVGNTHFDDANHAYTCPAKMYLRADRIPFEGFVGWDASSNGNLAQVLQEPSLMGAYEGAGVTVVGRGIRIPTNSSDLWGIVGGAGTFPDGSRYLNSGDCANSANTSQTSRDYATSNFLCNPSRIDGVSIINSSQGGGGIFAHGWNHYLEIANTRIYGNHGTLAGGINLGNGETPTVYTNDGTICGNGVAAPAPLCPPTGNNSLINNGTPPTNGAIPFQLNVKMHVHHNEIISNASIGDALFSGTPSGAGGVSISAGADNYKLDHNWIATNLSSGDGGGVQHAGLTFNGTIANNWILFNQSTNPTLPTNGGGLSIVGAASDRTLSNGNECGTSSDVDCPPGIGDGTGPGLVIDSNLILGNSAESGSGGGLRLQQLNGAEVGTFPLDPSRWYDVTVTNNVIANNVAGWDGGGVSLQDALKVTFVNNTVAANDTTASAGVLFKTLGAINSSAPPPGCVPTPDPTNPQNTLCLDPNAPHDPQPAGFVTMAHTPNLIDSLPAIVTCPTSNSNGNFPYSGALNGNCRSISIPKLTNDMFWQNRAFRVDIVGPGSDLKSQQNLVALTPALNQTTTGMCPTGANYWDIGARGDTGPTNHNGGATLTLGNSILTDLGGGYSGNGNLQPGASPVIAQYCNGARVPPETCSSADTLDQATCNGYNAPPGRSETTGLSPVFVFNNITPAATVDEGHNWLNLTYGPLTLSRPTTTTPTAPELMVASAATGSAGGAYSITGTSDAVNRGANNGLPTTTAKDFFGNPRASNAGNPTDIGAVEFQVAPGSRLVVASPAPLQFSNVVAGSGTATRDLTVSNNGAVTFTFTAITVANGPAFTRVSAPGNCPTTFNAAATLVAGASCTIRVQWVVPATAPATATGSVTITGTAGAALAVTNSPVTINANAVAATHLASVSPNPLAFGNWANGTTSAAQNLRVTNTGNSALAALTFGFGASTANFARVTTGTFPADAPTCGTTLAVGASCTVKVQFAPTAVTSYSRNLTVTATGATITTSPVVLTGTGVANKATVGITPNPMTITLQSPDVSINGSLSGTDLVTLTNTAATGGAQVVVTGVTATPATFQYAFTVGGLSGPDTCTGVALAPGASCTVSVRFTNLLAPRGVNRAGTIKFTDNATTATQTGGLVGFAPP